MCWLINCAHQHQCKYRPTKTPLRSWLLCIEHDVPTVCQSTCKASLNFTSKCEINVLLVVHSILWRQERQQQQTGNEERVSEGKMIKIKEAETDVRGKNWDQTDNDSETVVENRGKDNGGSSEIHRGISCRRDEENCLNEVFTTAPEVFPAMKLTQTE